MLVTFQLQQPHNSTEITFDLNRLSSESCFELSSDHSPIIVTTNINFNQEVAFAQLHNKQTNWTQFREITECSLPLKIALKCDQDIEDAVEACNSVIQNAGWISIDLID